jgi:hypothetical protein
MYWLNENSFGSIQFLQINIRKQNKHSATIKDCRKQKLRIDFSESSPDRQNVNHLFLTTSNL